MNRVSLVNFPISVLYSSYTKGRPVKTETGTTGKSTKGTTEKESLSPY